MRQDQEQQPAVKNRLAVRRPVEVNLDDLTSLREPAIDPSASRWLDIAMSLLALPTAPFHEQFVLREVLCQAELAGLEAVFDASGNLVVDLPGRGTLANQQPLLLTAHTDHPGFWADEMVDQGMLWAHWIGRVPESYFIGSKVQFFTDGFSIDDLLTNHKQHRPASSSNAFEAITGVIVEVDEYKGEGDYARLLVEVDRPVEPGAIGQWAIEGCDLNDGMIQAGAIDDVAGVAALVCVMHGLKEAEDRRPTRLLFTRAEEAGFVGCMGYCKQEAQPHIDSAYQIIGVEMSMAMPDAPVGSGPIVRVGDRRTVFDPSVTATCVKIAERLALEDKSFKWQRRLMPGGTCETSVFQSFLGTAGAVCLPLGNYHNVDRVNKKLDREYIDAKDYLGLVQFLGAIACSPCDTDIDGDFRDIFRSLYERHEHLLSDNVATPKQQN